MKNVALVEPTDYGGKALPGQDELPSEDGEPMETGFHDAQNALLKDTLSEGWGREREFFVAGNMFVYFSERQVKNNDFRGPDVFVVLGVPQHGRKSWVAWDEGGRLPDVVIEVTSESTEQVDRGDKMRIYSEVWRAAAYFIFDPDTERLDGFELDTARRTYRPIEPDERGDFAVAPLGLKLGLRVTNYRYYLRNFVRWITPDGTPLPTPQERAENERIRAEKALERVRELEAELESRRPS